MRNQSIAVKSTTTSKKDLERLKQQLISARQCLLEKDAIIEGLRLDLAHLVEQLPRLKHNNSNSSMM